MMKKTVSLVAGVVLLLALIFSLTAFAKQDIKIKLDQETISLGEEPFLEKGRVMVPLKTFAQAVGAEVNWDAKSSTVWVNRDKIKVEIPLGKDILLIHRQDDLTGIPEERKMDVPAQIVQDTVFIPAGTVIACFGWEATWEAENQTLVVKTSLPYEIVGADELKENPALAAWYEENLKKAGLHFITQQDSTYVIISGGEKPTGGYKMVVESVTLTAPGKAYISSLLLKPAPDMLVTQAITYPHAFIRLKTDQIQRVDGQTKEDFARKTFGEMGYDLGGEDVQSIAVYNLAQEKIKEYPKEEFARIIDNLNKSTLDDNPYIEMIAGNTIKILLADNASISLTSYGSPTNYVATVQVGGAYATYHLVNPEIAGLLLGKN
ncbi:stalk domain-containing protein [Candidatus Formimonas warabiya]|uniref:Protease complex subunit PrcB family protein n=1 Tax=Formimonas warabiya TaxID=1761012 RepID=A0A3G1KVM6_FORW1|nr:stalk domain-containing protein [Candidatus Formimonas warabiya]ATW26538.1 hypothetical protein DCMF_18880 [Candidatus Formimonas warabiya]